MKEHFSSYVAVGTGERKIGVANNIEIYALGDGEVTLAVEDEKGSRERNLVIPGVLQGPECGRNNLLSVSERWNSDYYFDLNRIRGEWLGRDDGLSVTLREVNGLYMLQTLAAQGSVRALGARRGEEDDEKAASK